jgi:hypothetical protein
MHLEIKKLGLQTYNLEKKNPCTFMAQKQHLQKKKKTKYAKTMKISKKTTIYAKSLMNKVQYVIGPSLAKNVKF